MSIWDWFSGKTPVPPAPLPRVDDRDAAFEALLALREGNRTTVYADNLGNPTVGIGHRVLASDMLHIGDTISQAQVDMLFRTDSASAMASAVKQAADAGIEDPKFLPYLASVCFQLGNGWTAKFPNTWAMIVRGNYAAAADAFSGTQWDKQTPIRVQDFQMALKRLPPKRATSV